MVSYTPHQPGLFQHAKLAVIFYGQLRTGLYCLPWHTSALSKLTENYSVFVDLQTSNSYPNVKNLYTQNASSEADCFAFGQGLPNLRGFTIDYTSEELAPSSGYWHYARMFRSLLRTYAQAELSGEVFTHYLALRTDALVGPDADSLSKFVADLVKDPGRNFHSDCGPFRVAVSELGQGTGYGDLLMGASADVFTAVLGYCSRVLFNQPRFGWAKYPFGPNVMLYKACTWSNIGHKPTKHKVALVRPTADLTRPVLYSFPYHENFWRDQHKGM